MKKPFTHAMLAAAATALVTISSVGCGPSKPSTHTVTGTVTFQGDPVEGASVSFSPTEPDIRAAAGRTDSQGKYLLTTFEKDDGAMPGAYKVRVFKFDREPEPVVITDASDEADYPDDYDPAADDGTPPPQHVLPEKYNSHSLTPLSFTVEAGENTFDINLE